MAASSGYVSTGTLLRYDSGGGSYVTIAEVVSIESPEIAVNAVDFTHLTSDDEYREYKPGFKDGGSLSCTINYKKATVTLIKGWIDNDTTNTFRMVLPDNSYFQMSAFVTSFKPFDAPLDDKLGASLTIKLTGKPTFTEG